MLKYYEIITLTNIDVSLGLLRSWRLPKKVRDRHTPLVSAVLPLILLLLLLLLFVLLVVVVVVVVVVVAVVVVVVASVSALMLLLVLVWLV